VYHTIHNTKFIDQGGLVPATLQLFDHPVVHTLQAGSRAEKLMRITFSVTDGYAVIHRIPSASLVLPA
jgi:hypothetical protein